MTRLVTILACTAPLVFATAPLGSLRGASQDDGSASRRGLMASGSYEHLGCFKDMRNDRVLGNIMRSSHMTAAVCNSHCRTRGAMYMATQYGNECWCSTDDGVDYERHGVGKCDKFCNGDQNETCGGTNAFDLYKVDINSVVAGAQASDSPEYMDCYADKKGDRIMGHKVSRNDMTTDMCRSHCEGKSMYYGTQWSVECWCGTSSTFSDYERHGKGVCDYPCSGDPSVQCGGHDAFSLFRFIESDDDSGSDDANNDDSSSSSAYTPSPIMTPPTSQPSARMTPPTAQPVDPVESPTPQPSAPVTTPTAQPVDPVEPPTPQPSAPVTPPTAQPMDPVKPPTGGGEGPYPYGNNFKGDGTYYDGTTTSGNCAIRSPIPRMYDGMTGVAIGKSLYGDSSLCGACIEGSGSGVGLGNDPITGPFKAYVVDKCDECAEGALDFSQSGDGRWEIEWHFVPCPGGGDPTFLFEGSNPFYWKIQPRGTTTPVKELKVGGNLASRTQDNFFIVQDGSPYNGEQQVETTTIKGVTKTMGVSL